MREIRFQGKRIDNNEWVYGCYVFHKLCVRHDIWSDMDGEWHEVISKTVGQFLGHKDIEGKTMCEGDILEDDCGHRGTIEFDTDRFSWIHGENWGEIEPERDKLEIIGNIHDNPELLK